MRLTSVLCVVLLGGCYSFEDYQARRALLVDDDGDGFNDVDGDCDDADPAIHPANTDICNGVDDDCDASLDEDADRTWYPDLDGDAFGDDAGALRACVGPTGWVEQPGDCDDGDGSASPASREICDLVDNDCDDDVDEGHELSSWYADDDGDDYGDDARVVQACMAPPGYTAAPGDCDDAAAAVQPGAVEICKDGLDNDCDGGPGECAWSGATTAAAGADARLLGERTGTGLGQALAAGDVDDDGFDDLLVGSATGDGVWLLGGGDTRAAGDTRLTADTARTTLYADPSDFAPGFRFGTAVTLCDFDANGVPDLVTTGYAAGESLLFVFDGGQTGVRDTNDAYFPARTLGDLEGATLGCDDVDEDGDLDILVGAPAYDRDGVEDAGAVHVLYGGPLPSGTYWTDYDPPSATVYGEDVAQAFGASLAPFDLAANGTVDLVTVAGAEGSAGDGLAWVLTGPLESGTVMSGATQRLGSSTSRAPGGAVAAGDLDNDGYDDVIVGVPDDDTYGSATGLVYVFFGSEIDDGTESAREAGEISPATLAGGSVGMGFGGTLSVLPGVDEEPAQLVVGTALDDGGGVDAGAVYVWDGDTIDGARTTADATATWRGSAAGDGVGQAVSTGSDLDGDGYLDLAIGAPGVDDPSAEAGAIYLLFGSGL